jgi:hypothetical protein
MRTALIALACLAAPASAEVGIPTLKIDLSISQQIELLESLGRVPSDTENFALGSLYFLAAVEDALQLQWRTGMDQAMGDLGNSTGLPFLRLPVPLNPDPQPFQGAYVTQLFRDVGLGMEEARRHLGTIPDGSDFSLEYDLGDLWFDVNDNQTRDPGEGAADILGPQLMGWEWANRDPAAPLPVIRFDAADAAWLSAYTHLLSAISESVLAYDPAQSIDRVLAARQSLGVGLSDPNDPFSFDSFVDTFAMVEGALNQPPDAARAKAAKSHFLSMIADNRRFWAMVKQEKDNSGEWIPNDSQTSALGLTLPPGTGDRWLAVLSDGEALLNGRVLVPYWRGAGGQGINIGKLFDEPRPVSVTGWVQGWAAVPYLEQGPAVSGENLWLFEEMMFGNAGLMMVFLN